MSSSRGTALKGDGSGGVIGYGSRGSRNAVHPLLTANTRQTAATAPQWRSFVMVGLVRN
jgi:hypothetical protein